MQLVFSKQNKTFAMLTCYFSEKETSVISPLSILRNQQFQALFPVTAGKTKTWGIFLLICLLLMFDAMANYLHWFIQPIAVGWLWSTLGHVLQVWSLLGLTTEHTLSCRSPPDRPLHSLQWRAVTILLEAARGSFSPSENDWMEKCLAISRPGQTVTVV